MTTTIKYITREDWTNDVPASEATKTAQIEGDLDYDTVTSLVKIIVAGGICVSIEEITT